MSLPKKVRFDRKREWQLVSYPERESCPEKRVRTDRKRKRQRQQAICPEKKVKIDRKRKWQQISRLEDGPEVEVIMENGKTIRQGYIVSMEPNFHSTDQCNIQYNGKCVYHIVITYWGKASYPFIRSEFRYI